MIFVAVTCFRNPAQKWQLAKECLHHCKLMVQLLSSIPQVTQEVLARPPPGLLVLVDMMDGQVVFNAVWQVLAPGFKDLGVRMGLGTSFFLVICILLEMSQAAAICRRISTASFGFWG